MRFDKLRQYLRLAILFGQELSKDPSSKVAAFFLHPTEFSVLTAGYNGMPRGARDDAPGRLERPLKYSFFEHAERNAIFNIVRPDFAGTAVITTEALNVGIVRAIISVGSKHVFVRRAPGGADIDAVSRALLEETGVSLSFVHMDGAALVVDTALPGAHADHYGLRPFLEEACLLPSGIRATVFTQIREPFGISAKLCAAERLPGEAPETRYDTVLEAIFGRARQLLEGTTCVVSHRPCADCAQAVGAVGARHVVVAVQEDYETRWADSVADSKRELARLGVEVHEFRTEDLFRAPEPALA